MEMSDIIPDADCLDFRGIPLPCPRLLWDSSEREAWSRRLDKLKRELNLQKGLTVQDLKHHARSKSNVTADVVAEDAAAATTTTATTGAISSWCESADELGLLLWTLHSIET
jgi:hypothetical protein